MGGRGASSGMSKYGNPYGSQHHALFTSGNIKFVAKNTRASESLDETMTSGRVYVQVGGDEIKKIVYFDKDLKKSKAIEVDHVHNGLIPHVHDGYDHQEARKLTSAENKMFDNVKKIWENKLRG